MTETRFGHFGLPGILVAGGAVLALILHLAVPYAHVNYREEGQSSETLSRGEASDIHDNYSMTGASSPGVTLAGAIILAAAGLGLLVLGFVPLTVTAARWAGWTAALLALVGGLMTFMSSMFWVGSGLGQYPYGTTSFTIPVTGGEFSSTFGGLTGGLTGLVELAMQTDSAGTVIIIGPVLVALVSAVAILSALTVCGNVISVRDGLRERAGLHLRNARIALAVLALVLLLPWSIGKAPDYAGDGDRDWYVFGAHTIMNTEALTDGTLFKSLTYAMNVFIAAAWIGVLLGVIGSLGGVLASQNAPPELARLSHYTVFGTLFMTFYMAVVYILAWIYMWKPRDNMADFQPGYFAILVLPVLVLWGLGQVKQVRSHMARKAETTETTPTKKVVSFD